MWGKDPISTLFDILVQDEGFTSVAVFGMSEPDVSLALMQPWVSVDNDSQGTAPDGPLGKGTRTRAPTAHSRAFSASTCGRRSKLPLEEAIRKFAALPAQRMRFTDRGVLKEGLWADIVVFDPEQIKDLATFENPNQLSVGMQYVLVNGVPVIDDGKATNALPGKVLRGAAATQP